MAGKKGQVTNPQGYNQSKPDPRQAIFLSQYLNPKSDTFSNAYQSAIAAGYDENYAKTITTKGLTWMSESVGTDYIVKRAEKNLKEFLEPEFEDNKIKADMSKFALSRLAKEKYSDRTEHTGKDGKDLPTPIYGGLSQGTETLPEE